MAKKHIRGHAVPPLLFPFHPHDATRSTPSLASPTLAFLKTMSSTNTAAEMHGREALAAERGVPYLRLGDQQPGEGALWQVEARLARAQMAP